MPRREKPHGQTGKPDGFALCRCEEVLRSVHGSLSCTGCHADLEGKELPHEVPLARVECGGCHETEEQDVAVSLHGKAAARGDRLAPRCSSCHGAHDIIPVANPKSSVARSKCRLSAGSCHKEGAPVARQREIHASNILENYSESMHGEGLLKKGLVVAATCASCHTAHKILPHTDGRSSIARKNIASTCTRCHAEIEAVHRKVIKGSSGRRRQTCCRPAWIATSPTRPARCFMIREWRTTIAWDAIPGVTSGLPGTDARSP